MELVVVDDRGHVWVGAAAFIMCLWALADHRELSYTLSNTMLAPLAERFFVMLSSRRKRVAAWLFPRAMTPPAACLPRRSVRDPCTDERRARFEKTVTPKKARTTKAPAKRPPPLKPPRTARREGRTTAARGDETRALIIEVALGLFRKEGFDGTTMRAIANEAGIALGNLRRKLTRRSA